ncbi:APC family permease [Streptomyces sp. NPDC102360]|uniref:APC family permease n=1 Tax=Streptomyces sp. NPDC102360 TaxID=3366160 RepID=UPI0038034F3C
MSAATQGSGSPELKGHLSLASVVTFGVSYMAPSLVIVLFGVVASASSGTAPTAFLLATGAMCLTALSYARMARRYPASGSAYVYARRQLGAPVGFLVGWAVLLDYLFLPMMAWLVQSVYLNAQFPAVPVWVWLIVNAVLTTVVNIIGLNFTDRLNKAFTALAVLLVLLFVIYCLIHLAGHRPASYSAPLWNDGTTLAGVSAAAAVAAYSYLGFDAVTTLAEETRDPARTIPRAVVLVVAIGGLLFAGVAYVMQLVHPGGQFANPDIAGYTLSVQVGGQAFADWTNTATIIGGFASGVAVQLSTSRLLYTMGRDGVLPRRVFGILNPRTHSPVRGLLVTAAMAAVGLNISLATATSFVNFGAFLAFTAVNACTIAYYIRHRRTEPGVGALGYLLIPALAACVTIYLLTQLSGTALTIGVCWLCAGLGWLAWITRGFSRPTPEVIAGTEATPPTAAQEPAVTES